MACLKCGDCCNWFYLIVSKNRTDIDFLKCHGMEVEEDVNEYRIKIKNTCHNLLDGICIDYENRPELCKNFRCEKNVFDDFPEMKN